MHPVVEVEFRLAGDVDRGRPGLESVLLIGEAVGPVKGEAHLPFQFVGHFRDLAGPLLARAAAEHGLGVPLVLLGNIPVVGRTVLAEPAVVQGAARLQQ